MRKYIVTIVSALMFVALVGLGLAVQPAPAAPLAIPTETLAASGPPGDFVSKSYGGIYNKAIGVVGSSDEQQFTVKANATQTANLFEVQSSAGAVLWGLQSTGAMTGTAFKYATQTGVATGTRILHNVGTTPTLVMAWCVSVPTATTFLIGTHNYTSTTFDIQAAGAGICTAGWMAFR